MLEADMYPLFELWLEHHSDMFMQEPLIPHNACFDFIAFKDGLLTVYELKLRNAKKVIQQANTSLLWCDHSYAVLPEEKIHLGMKYKHLMLDNVGLISMRWQPWERAHVTVVIEPKSKKSHMTLPRLRQYMIEWMVKDWIYRHRCYVDTQRSESRARLINRENHLMRKGK
jgi:hypothetical protein